MASYDVIIKNGAVFDGKGSKPEKVDVGINGDEIKKIGNLQDYDANTIIDAQNKYVCPGFIDLTSHSDTHWTLFTHPAQESLLRQGITTILGGNCGSSIAPLLGKKGPGDIERWVDVSNININWQTMDELFSELENRKLGVNFASLVGLGTLLDTSEGELKQIHFLLEKSLKDGAFGLSTSLGLAHLNSFRDEDLINLFATAAENKALTKHHLEDEGKNILPAISRLIQAARKSGASLHFSHFKILGKQSWQFFESALEMMRNARREGIKLTVDFSPYERTGSDLFMLLPDWLRKKSKSEIKDILRMRENEQRRAAVEYLKNLTLHYDKIIIASSLYEIGNIGKTLAKISESSGLPPEEVILNLLSVNNLHVSIFSEVVSIDHIRQLAKENYSIVASDGVGYDVQERPKIQDQTAGLPHPRSFGAFSRAARMLAREDKILTWEEMIHRMTGLPAEILGLLNRGTLAKNNKADIIVFNPEKISDYATYENPFQFSVGVEQVLINGRIVLSDDRLTGEFAGQVIRR